MDTIAAIATSPGRGGVGVIRISGPQSTSIASAVVGSLPPPREAGLRRFSDNNHNVLDHGLVLYFNAPHSFTGEDVVELQGHGGPVVLELILEALLAQGARLASPGEFTQRAFLNGKLDLAQAEAVADLIDASTKEAALGASRSLQGAFSERVSGLANSILHLRIRVEASIDFPDEEVDILTDSQIVTALKQWIDDINQLCQQAHHGQLLREGMVVAIVGKPNVGKSSLLNCLTQEDTAIVTPIAGTTRDIIKASVQIDGIPVHLVDTAGIRESIDPIEQEGIARSQHQQRLADVILLIKEATQIEQTDIERDILATWGEKVMVVMNKLDLLAHDSKKNPDVLYISAKNQEGIAQLKSRIKQRAGGLSAQSQGFISRCRHTNALQRAQKHAQVALHQLTAVGAFELACEELRLAHDVLGEIVGKVTSDNLLGEIFSQFCIGK